MSKNKDSRGFVYLIIFLILLILVITTYVLLPKNYQQCVKFPGSSRYSLTCTTFYGKLFNSDSEQIYSPISVPTKSIEKNSKRTSSSYSDGLTYINPKYTLVLPSECKEDTYKDQFDRDQFTITCKTDAFTIMINPQAGGRGLYWTGEIREGVINAGNIMIDMTNYISKEKDKSFSFYYVTSEKNNLETEFMIDGYYSQYSDEAQNYLNQIISTFEIVSQE